MFSNAHVGYNLLNKKLQKSLFRAVLIIKFITIKIVNKPMPTEYDYIDIIGTTHEIAKNFADEKMNEYYHKQEVRMVQKLVQKMNLTNYENVIDLGCSIGTWYPDYKKLGFKRIVGIDISEERANEAKKRGYDEVHICNASKLPFENESVEIIISNDVLVHVLQDSDKLKIFQEVKRILKNGGIFIFNFANANGNGFQSDTTKEYCRWNTIQTMSTLIKESGLNTEFIIPGYYAMPRIGAHPKAVSFSTTVVFPILDLLLQNARNFSLSKVIYFGVRKLENF